MDKLKRVLSGNDDTSNDENRGIMGDVGAIINKKKNLFMTYLVKIIVILYLDQKNWHKLVIYMPKVPKNLYQKGCL